MYYLLEADRDLQLSRILFAMTGLCICRSVAILFGNLLLRVHTTQYRITTISNHVVPDYFPCISPTRREFDNGQNADSYFVSGEIEHVSNVLRVNRCPLREYFVTRKCT